MGCTFCTRWAERSRSCAPSVLHAAPRQPPGSGPDRRPRLGPAHQAALTRLTSAEEKSMLANDGRHVPSHHHARTRTISAGAAAIITLALAACTATTAGSASTFTGTAHGQQRRSRRHSYRLRLNIRRAVLRPGVRQIPPGKPCSGDRLLRGGQQRGHRRLQREAGRFRCMLQQVTGPDGARLLS